MHNAFEVSPAFLASLKISAPSRDGGPAYLDTAAASKLIRHMLKAAFPAVKFSVRSSRYAGGSSISIRWQDGPSQARVDAMVSPLEGKGFDGMQDLSYLKAPFTLNGQLTQTYCYIHCSRELSASLKDRAAKQIGEYFDCEVPSADERGRMVGPDGYHDWSTMIYRACEDRTRYAAR